MAASKSNAEREFVDHVSRWIPKFQDVFDEETFYIFVIVLVILSLTFAIIMSRFFTIRDAGHIDWYTKPNLFFEWLKFSVHCLNFSYCMFLGHIYYHTLLKCYVASSVLDMSKHWKRSWLCFWWFLLLHSVVISNKSWMHSLKFLTF